MFPSTLIFLLFFQGDAAVPIICCGVPLLMLIVVFYLMHLNGKAQNELRLKRLQELEKSKNSYYQSLKTLKSNPTNADLKEQTLSLGRRYSELTRQFQTGDKNITIYDEMALMNDINAACAAASVSFVTHQQSSEPLSIESRLKRLTDLKERGLMSEEEYQAKRQKILDEI